MQAVAILMIASTMGGDFPTNEHANSLRLPPVLRSTQTTGRSLLDQAMRSTAETATAASDAAVHGAKRAGDIAREKARRAGNSALGGVRRVANELSLDPPKSRVAQAQYQQDGLPRRPIDGMMGPGSRAAASDPTAAYGGRMQAVPPAGHSSTYSPVATNPLATNPLATNPLATKPPALTLPADRTPVTPSYRPPSKVATDSRTSPSLDLPPLLNDRQPAAPAPGYRAQDRYSPVTRTPTNPTRPDPGLAFPTRPERQETVSAPIPPYNPPATQAYNPPTTRSYPPTEPTRSASNPIIPTPGQALDNSITAVKSGTRGAIQDIHRGAVETGEAVRTGGSYFMTLLTLFASVGLNLYLGWIAWDTYNRYQDLVADMRSTGSRRERRRERRRFTEPSSSAAAY